MWDERFRYISTITYSFDLESSDVRPIHLVPYQAKPEACDFEGSEINTMLAMNVNEPAQSEWASSMVFAPEEDGTLAFSNNCREPNNVAVRDSYPHLRMAECIDSLADAHIFYTRGKNSSYRKNEVDPFDCEKTAFNSDHVLYQFI